MTSPSHPYLEALAPVVRDVVGPSAVEVDRAGTFPRAGVQALADAGLLGLVSAVDVGGAGQSHRAAVLVVEELARHCGSTAMVMMMHYTGAAAVEAHGRRAVREEVAAGRHLLALALSEPGSRSHFWVPLSSAAKADGSIRLDARKSWVTSAGQADSYVWSSRPVAAEGLSTLWLVPGTAPGLSVGAPFDGLGLRGNCSSPMTADGVVVPRHARLGADGGGFDVLVATLLPYFLLMNAGFSVGTMDATTAKAAAHVGHTRMEHLDQVLAQTATVRAT
jgi:isovaleryl-CoA dehydrogenase